MIGVIFSYFVAGLLMLWLIVWLLRKIADTAGLKWIVAGIAALFAAKYLKDKVDEKYDH